MSVYDLDPEDDGRDPRNAGPSSSPSFLDEPVAPATPRPLPAGESSGPPPGWIDRYADEPAPAARPEKPRPAGISPADVIGRWRHEGPLVRVATGIAPLDDACRGGLPIPWRVVIVGAPAAGKTFMEIAIADSLARSCSAAGLYVGILAVDEDPDDLTVRLAQIAGFTVAQAELRDPETLDAMEAALCGLRVRMYDASWTIDAAAADVHALATSEGRQAALFIDSAQTARSSASKAIEEPSARQVVEANTETIRAVSSGLRMIVVATSEANRNAYRSEDAAERGNDLAAGAESRTLEYSAQTLLMLRTPKDHRDVIHVRIAKNRRADAGIEFWLCLDRDRHKLTECPDPDADPNAKAEAQNRKRAGVKAEVARDADALLDILRRHPTGIGEKDLRAAIRGAGIKMGVDKLDAARAVLVAGHREVRLVDLGKGGDRAPRLWSLAPLDAPCEG